MAYGFHNAYGPSLRAGETLREAISVSLGSRHVHLIRHQENPTQVSVVADIKYVGTSQLGLYPPTKKDGVSETMFMGTDYSLCRYDQAPGQTHLAYSYEILSPTSEVLWKHHRVKRTALFADIQSRLDNGVRFVEIVPDTPGELRGNRVFTIESSTALDSGIRVSVDRKTNRIVGIARDAEFDEYSYPQIAGPDDIQLPLPGTRRRFITRVVDDQVRQLMVKGLGVATRGNTSVKLLAVLQDPTLHTLVAFAPMDATAPERKPDSETPVDELPDIRMRRFVSPSLDKTLTVEVPIYKTGSAHLLGNATFKNVPVLQVDNVERAKWVFNEP